MVQKKIHQHRIILVAAAILIIAALLVSIGVFAVMQHHTEALLSNSLQSSLHNRVQLTQIEIHSNYDRTVFVASRPVLIDRVQQTNTGAKDAVTGLTINDIAQSLLTGFTAIALYNKNGVEIAHAGTFVTQSAMTVPLNLPEQTQLMWDGQLILHTVVKMKQSGHIAGTVITETFLPISTNAFKEANRLGKTEELRLCAPLGARMRCFPSKLYRTVMIAPQYAPDGHRLPMAHGLAGETGLTIDNDYRNRMVVAAYAPVDKLGLGMVLKIDRAELYASIWYQLRFLIPLLLVVITVILLLLRWLVSPLIARLVRSETDATGMSVDLRNSERRLRALLDNVDEGIVSISEQGIIELFNPGAERMFGYSNAAVLGQNVSMLMPEPYHSAHDGYLAQYRQTGQAHIIGVGREVQGLRCNGEIFHMDLRISEFHLDGRRQFIGITRDISERKEFESRLQYQASHDVLTSLPNRTLFQDVLRLATSRALRNEKLLAVMFLDLDKFKYINDTLGHEYGDLLLKEIANRLSATLRKSDLVAHGDALVARQGGDEFTILLQDISTVHYISQIAEKILAAIAKPFSAAGHEIHVTASIGITVFPFDDTDIGQLLQNADIAMYRAKEYGQNNYQFYTAAMNVFMQERMEIENGLRHALKKGELLLHYQPQVALDSGEIIAVEALLRWNHPVKGLIPPDLFIPVAEESGLIVSIGEWVLRTACQQNKAWQEAGLPHIRMAVNLSARQFKEPHLVEVVARVLADTKLDPYLNNLELEVTESMIMKDMNGTIATLNQLHAMGVRLAIDDFGMGYSSLSYLKRFPINTLKIDQSFIRDISLDADDATITALIVTLGHSLKLRVIAEGVETAEQLAYLREIKCDEIQGYYFSKPVPAEELAQLLREGRQLR